MIKSSAYNQNISDCSRNLAWLWWLLGKSIEAQVVSRLSHPAHTCACKIELLMKIASWWTHMQA